MTGHDPWVTISRTDLTVRISNLEGKDHVTASRIEWHLSQLTP